LTLRAALCESTELVPPHSPSQTPPAALSADASSPARTAIDTRHLPGLNKLAVDYVWDYGRLERFYAGNPETPQAWRDAVARVRAHARPRDGVTAVIEAQQRRRGAPPAAVAAGASLRDPQTVAVVTGQQAGLFGGPLFTLLKALTAIRLAERVRVEHQVPAVAVFWVDAEDHDWQEVRAAHVLDAETTVRTVTLADLEGCHTEPVGRLQLDASVEVAIAELEGLLPPSASTADVMAALRRAYRPGVSMADAFARFLEDLLGPRGLIVYDASDPAAKPFVADLFAREVELAGGTSTRAAAAGAALEALGYHAQVAAQADGLALFSLSGGRQGIKVAGDTCTVGDREEPASALRDRARQHPDAFGPNVLLRPLVQDTLFPTVCYVAGPSELAYLGQLREVYAAFGVPMPLIYQRATATLLDSNATRFLTRHDLPLWALRAQDESVLNELLAAALPPSVEASLQDAAQAIDARMAVLAAEVPQIDATLEGATRSALGRMQDDLKKLQGKIIQAAKRKDETLRRQFKHAQALAFPCGAPQERVVSLV
jgi:bacillithiol biosynthesis cysteine-adding enzyme BshC